MIIAIDPGRDKCGLAVLDRDGNVLEKRIIPRTEIKARLFQHLSSFSPASIIMGNSSNGRQLKEDFKDLDIKFSFVSEKNSSLEARKLYWEENPPRGLWKIIPTSLRLPPVPVDDYAAVILGKRYLKS